MAAICVDKAFIPAKVGRIFARWCHLFTDEPRNPEALEALHAFAAGIGMKREWFHGSSCLPHYDVTEGMRGKALKAGALPADREKVRAVLEQVYGKENAGFLPDPQ